MTLSPNTVHLAQRGYRRAMVFPCVDNREWHVAVSYVEDAKAMASVDATFFPVATDQVGATLRSMGFEPEGVEWVGIPHRPSPYNYVIHNGVLDLLKPTSEQIVRKHLNAGQRAFIAMDMLRRIEEGKGGNSDDN